MFFNANDEFYRGKIVWLNCPIFGQETQRNTESSGNKETDGILI
jgi:hypothetical protein